jgi:hypothetical protein
MMSETLPTHDLDFSEALANMKARCTMARKGWNGKEQFVYYVEGSRFIVNRKPLNMVYPEGTEITYRPHLDMRAADGVCGPWSPTQADLLSNDWFVVRDLLAEQQAKP